MILAVNKDSLLGANYDKVSEDVDLMLVCTRGAYKVAFCRLQVC